MKTIIFTLVIFISASYSQNIYEVIPGTKGNQIQLTVANVSEANIAENVNVSLVKKSSSIEFKNETGTIELIESNNEGLVTFTFDTDRNAPVNQKDTIGFMITYAGTSLMKSFILNYLPPKDYKLEQNFPNPFNPTTTIQYQIPASPKERTIVTLKVYDILGSEVATLVNEEQEAGFKEVKFDASSFASGIYIYRLVSGSNIFTKKMMVIK